jgi:hypothetical protein
MTLPTGRKLAVAGAMALAILAACARHDPIASPSTADPARYGGAQVEIVGDGGLGAFVTRSLIVHDSPTFLFTRHRICSVPSCQPALDSAAGALSATVADALFATIERNDPFALKDDYGITQGGADMVTYTVRVTILGRTKTVRADDGTMPEPLRRIEEAVRSTVDAARR